jgi:hypothetical protein
VCGDGEVPTTECRTCDKSQPAGSSFRRYTATVKARGDAVLPACAIFDTPSLTRCVDGDRRMASRDHKTAQRHMASMRSPLYVRIKFDRRDPVARTLLPPPAPTGLCSPWVNVTRCARYLTHPDGHAAPDGHARGLAIWLGSERRWARRQRVADAGPLVLDLHIGKRCGEAPHFFALGTLVGLRQAQDDAALPLLRPPELRCGVSSRPEISDLHARHVNYFTQPRKGPAYAACCSCG